MIASLRGHVLLDEADAVYVARALELLGRLLRENRSEPAPRLQSVTAKLAQCAESGSAPGSSGSNNCRRGASQADPDHDAGYALLSTAEAARVMGTSERNIRDLAARGAIPACRSGGRWLLDAAAVEARGAAKAARRAG